MLKFLCCTMLFSSVGAPQAGTTPNPAAAIPVYEVVVIKPNRTDATGINIDIGDTTFQATNVTAKMLIVNATGIRMEHIFGLPTWAENSRFDVNAKVVDRDPRLLQKFPRESRKAMLLDVLKDRFHLAFHNESKVLPVYDLVVARDGPKFKSSVLLDGSASGSMSSHDTELKGRGVRLQAFAEHLEQLTDRSIIDKTGLSDRYDLHLIWIPDRDSSDNAAPNAPPHLFTALQEQLGLKLVASKGPVQTFVVDHIEQPSEN